MEARVVEVLVEADLSGVADIAVLLVIGTMHDVAGGSRQRNDGHQRHFMLIGCCCFRSKGDGWVCDGNGDEEERSVDWCGEVHVRFVGLGHTLIGVDSVENGQRSRNSDKRTFGSRVNKSGFLSW
ncbi:unnamed protein product [Vicia faba]|uniref:Uncharacterized protein n=1 Tax=Vicia faba TaxID=3906 RepID=A0AAV0ZY46_VICFA|nr:unnamed protein product [Vicia faba]